MIQQILNSNYGKPQGAFSIITHFRKANQLAVDHPVIIKIQKELSNVSFIDRDLLLNKYNNVEISFSTKILLAFWWGGLSHQYQAPLFYKEDNLDKIQNFSEDLEIDLRHSINLDEHKFKVSLSAIFKSLYDGNYKMDGIKISYFTKIFQFFFKEAYDKGLINVLPIIADKWSMRAGFAMMLEDGFDYKTVFREPRIESAKNIEINFSGSNMNVFDSYWGFAKYFTEKAYALNEANPSMDFNPFKLEEILFGRGRDWNNVNNPRRVYSEFILSKF